MDRTMYGKVLPGTYYPFRCAMKENGISPGYSLEIMPPKNKKEERLAAQRLCKKRKYAEIKNDPKLYAMAKEKRRQKYLKEKETKKVTSISEKSRRAQKEQRAKWRENSFRYRQRQKETKQPTFECLQIQTVSENDSSPPKSYTSPSIDPLISGAIRKIRYTELKKRMLLMKIIMAYKKRDKARCRLIQRLKNKLVSLEINRSNVTSIVEPTSSTSEIEVKTTATKMMERIKCYYLDDANSVLTSGKKEYITRNKQRMQKRYLCQPLKDLYKKFILETKLAVSYSFFCKLRPFWVVFPKSSDRDTCQCSLHGNMELLMEALNKASIINEKNIIEVLSKLCCDSRNLDCLKRSCGTCKSCIIEFKDFSNDNSFVFYEWKKVKKEITVKNGAKRLQTLSEKVKTTIRPVDAVAFERDMTFFFNHEFKIVHQYKAIKNLKENLNFQEACVHVDFSENYALKFATEVQSFHFGGSRQQVCLHTAVIYTHIFSTGAVTPTSMCTISNCLRHDASAIWAHLIPLIEQTIKLNPFIDTIHFLSDSPTSQYRNKYMFFLISQIYQDFSQIERVTWNYSEAGHGKGAPDGVGATIKRTADSTVRYGADVGTFDQFCDLLTRLTESKGLNIIIKKIKEEEVVLKESLIPKNLKAFKGTFDVYQVLWDKSAPKTTLRSLSCFDCGASQKCVHGKDLGYVVNLPNVQKENIAVDKYLESDVVPLARTSTIRKYGNVSILSEIKINKYNIKEFIPRPSTSKE